jgi:hypothetical protein
MPPPPPPPPLSAVKTTAARLGTASQSEATLPRSSGVLSVPGSSVRRDLKSVLPGAGGVCARATAAGVDADLYFMDCSGAIRTEEPEESSNGSRLENLSIQDFVDQYHFNPERLERVVLELEEENRLNQVEGFHSPFSFVISRSSEKSHIYR